MYSLNVIKSFSMKDYVPGDERLFVEGHAANALSGLEVKELVGNLGEKFSDHFEAGNEATENLLANLSIE